MKTQNIVDLTVAKFGVSKAEAKRFVAELLGQMTQTLQKGEKISLSGFGTFSVTERAERNGRNPQTGATIKIKASKNAKFKASTSLKKELNK